MSEADIHLLEALRPLQANKIIDLVEQVGINISPWGVNKDGSKVKTTAANPSYCYEWAFGGNREETLLCIWHRSLKISNGLVSFEDNFRHLALELVRKTENEDQKIRSRSSSQAKRARNFDRALLSCFQKSKPVRVVILEGDPRSKDELGFDSSKVKFRSLDSEQWFVHDYNYEDGLFRLIRAVPPQEANPSMDEQPVFLEFLDQFSLPEDYKTRESVGSVYVRSPEVRRKVLRRAGGTCEFCGESGFKMNNGAIFLETHHVIPLSEGGSDCESNVVAICPNDHRRAHFGEDREQIRNQFLVLLDRESLTAALSLQSLLGEDAPMSFEGTDV